MGLSPSVQAALALPLLIFLAEVCVVTLNTIRIIFVARGRKYLAPLLGMLEVAIWLFAIGQIMQNLNDVCCYVAFAGGFAVGNFLGIFIEQRLAIGSLAVRVVTSKDARLLVADLKAARYGVTSLEGRGTSGPVRVVVSVIPRKELATLVSIIHGFDPTAFYSVEEVQSVRCGHFPAAGGWSWGWPRLGRANWATSDSRSEPTMVAYR